MQTPPDWGTTARQIAALRARQASARDAAHFSLPHRAGPFLLQQMLPRHALLLYAMANPLFNGRPAWRCKASDVLGFLFVVSTAAADGGGQPGFLRRLWLTVRLMAVRLRLKSWLSLCRALDHYVFETFVDCPPSASGDGSGRDSGAGIRPSFLSSIINTIACEYHWGRAEIYATPMRELLLYRKHIIAGWKAKTGEKFHDTSTEEMALRNDYLVAVENFATRGGLN